MLSLREAGERLGVSSGTLLVQIRNGALVAQKIGTQWVVTVQDLAAYDERRKQPRGFARPDHPLHGKRGGGGRRKKPEH
ncbi:MAG: helix-turn-helix domain-containing protein [Thermomicrobiales bacterium]